MKGVEILPTYGDAEIVCFGADTDEFFYPLIARSRVRYASIGFYRAFVRDRRLNVIKLDMVKAAKRVGIRVADVRGHETDEFWRFERTLPAISILLDIDLVHMRKLFLHSRKYNPSWIYHRMSSAENGDLLLETDDTGAVFVDPGTDR